jgi:DNA-binding transcriptional LysR family regulator
MHTILHRGGPQTDHAEEPSTQVPDWEGLRTFLEVVRRGSFRAAAETICTSSNAVRRRIDELERQLGEKLVTRHIAGVTVTARGEQVFDAVTKMELAYFSGIRARDAVQPASKIKLAATEAFGTFWITPLLVEYQRANPQLVVDLSCAMQSADVLRLEADAAIQLTKPTSPDLKLVRLGRIHSMPSAAPSYLARYGTPKSAADLKNHRVVLQFAEQTSTQEIYNRLWPTVPEKGFVTFRTNNSSALLWSILKGAGIGWAPTYIHALKPRIVPIDIDLIFPFDVWLTYHPDAAKAPEARRLIDWVISSFDPKMYPWFRDEFIHPRDLHSHYHGPPLTNLFERRDDQF